MGVILYATFLSLLCVSSAELLQAIVKLQGSSYVAGNITLSQSDNGPVTINGRIVGLSQGKHGFHIHEKGDITGGCGSTGGHYNPYQKTHGAPNDVDRHVGDLGNIVVGADGVAEISITDSLISLQGPNSVLGRAVVVHSDVDDLGKGGKPDSLQTGHAGGRVVCGVIGVLSPPGKWPSNAATTASTAPAIIFTVVALLLAK